MTLNYCHLPVGGIDSGCSSMLWTGDISLGLPSTCSSNGARQPCRLAKAVQISLAEKELQLCKRKNFNIIPNYEPQNLHHDSLSHGFSLVLERHHGVTRSGERPVTILQDSFNSILIIIFILYDLLRLFKSLPQVVNCNHFYYLCHISYISYISHIRKSVAAMKEIVRCNEKVLDWEF